MLGIRGEDVENLRSKATEALNRQLAARPPVLKSHEQIVKEAKFLESELCRLKSTTGPSEDLFPPERLPVVYAAVAAALETGVLLMADTDSGITVTAAPTFGTDRFVVMAGHDRNETGSASEAASMRLATHPSQPLISP